MTTEQLISQIQTKKSFLCIGLDVDLTKIPQHLLQTEDPIFEFNKAIIDATHDICVSYKPNINDLRESPALDIIHLLREKGAIVTYNDPYVPEIEIEGDQMVSEKELSSCLEKSDLVAIITNHDKFDYKLIFEKSPLIFDARNALKDIAKKDMKVIKL